MPTHLLEEFVFFGSVGIESRHIARFAQYLLKYDFFSLAGRAHFGVTSVENAHLLDISLHQLAYLVEIHVIDRTAGPHAVKIQGSRIENHFSSIVKNMGYYTRILK